MRNIINQKDFINKYKKSLQLNEAEGGGNDFSNRVGWSTSLVGRIFNKTFSFFAKKAYMVLLNVWKNKIDNEYMKALLLTLKKYDVKSENLKSELTEEQKSEIIYNSEEENKKYALSEGEPYSDAKVEKDVDKITIKEFIKKNDVEEAKKYQIVFLKNITNKINPNNVSEDDKAMLIHISSKLNDEEKKFTDDSKALEIIKTTKNNIDDIISKSEGDKTIDDNRYEEIIKTKTYKTSEEIEKEANALFQELTDEYETALKIVGGEKTEKGAAIKKAYRNFSQTTHPDKVTTKEKLEDAKKSVKDFKQKLITISNSNESTSSKSFNECINEMYNITNLLSEKLGNNTTTKIMSSKLSNIIRTGDKSIDKEYGDINVLDFDPYKALSEMDSETQKKFRLDLIANVNKEKLKEYQLKAEWIYDEDKYKDKRNDVYSRINWTTTGPDQNKLKNKWFQMLASVKAQYVHLFSATGDFPQNLDPPALVNGDKKFRDLWNNTPTEQIQNGMPSAVKNPIISDDSAKSISIKKVTKIPNGNYALLDCESTTKDGRKPFGLIVYKTDLDNNVKSFQPVAICDIQDILKSCKELDIDSDADLSVIKENIEKYTHTIKNPNLDKCEDIYVRIFNTFLQNPDSIKSEHKIRTLLRKEEVSGSENQYSFVYMINTIDNGTKIKKTYIINYKKDKYDETKLVEYTDNMTFSKEYSYKYLFHIKGVFEFVSDKVWKNVMDGGLSKDLLTNANTVFMNIDENTK